MAKFLSNASNLLHAIYISSISVLDPIVTFFGYLSSNQGRLACHNSPVMVGNLIVSICLTKLIDRYQSLSKALDFTSKKQLCHQYVGA